jgi:integral membrane sensor domain MASE1
MFHSDEHSAGISGHNVNRDKPSVDLFFCIFFPTMIMTLWYGILPLKPRGFKPKSNHMGSAKVFSASFHSTNCCVLINHVIDAILYTHTDSVVYVLIPTVLLA